jgi:hypothetical protein
MARLYPVDKERELDIRGENEALAPLSSLSGVLVYAERQPIPASDTPNEEPGTVSWITIRGWKRLLCVPVRVERTTH